MDVEWCMGEVEEVIGGQTVPGILRGDYGIPLVEMDILMDLAIYDSEGFYVLLGLARIMLNRYHLPVQG